jgi:membrane protease YdiL (CAAX protease family)
MITLGLAISLFVIAILWIMAIMVTPGSDRVDWASITTALPRLILAAAVIAVIEEAFFRAFLMGGLVADFDSAPALIISSAIYSAAHLVRSPARFYLTSLDWIAGFHCIASGLSNLAAPESAAALFGLFLLGLLLGRGFFATAGVYLSIGLHAGFVLGAKLWRLAAPAQALLPNWLGGFGSQPVISGAAAWIAALVLLVCIGPISILGRRPESHSQSS